MNTTLISRPPSNGSCVGNATNHLLKDNPTTTPVAIQIVKADCRSQPCPLGLLSALWLMMTCFLLTGKLWTGTEDPNRYFPVLNLPVEPLRGGQFEQCHTEAS